MSKKHRKKSGWTVFFRSIKIMVCVLLIVTAMAALAGGAIYMKYSGEIEACKERADEIMAESKREDFSQPSDTKIYDSSGEVIGLINSGHYEYVPISEISKNLQNAYIAQEDRRFYKHHGVDFIGLVRAGIALVRNKGEITQGGSTITQQVIKNTYLTQEQSFIRKITEIFAAPQMEEKYSKGEIMEFYCNTNFYANRCYGVAKASLYYFDKEPKDLTVWEAATLAGISNNPSRYNPVAHPQEALKKRNQIIDNMEETGFISKMECSAAKLQPLTVAGVYEEGTKETYQSSYAVHCAAIELMKNDGFIFQYIFPDQGIYNNYRERYQEAYQEKSDLIRNGGFEIHTSLDSNLQETLQKYVDEDLAKFTDLQENGKYALQGAAVCIDNQTGYVVAIVGGRGTGDEYNRGFLSRRQPGSTIKPLIDYAPAFESGFYYPSRLVNDHLFEDGPKNSGGKYHGEISVREALNRSLNTVAWQVLADIGVDKGIAYLGKMHFSGISYLDNGNTSMSIGGFTEGARIVDMARGYSVLASGGMYSNKTCITGIVSQYDGDVYRDFQPEERIFTEDTAYMITDVLKGTLDKPYGTGYGLGLAVPAAGKTGTTNSNKDAWFCGYTKYYTTAVWMGYDTPKAMPGVYGKTYAGKIWHDFMAECHEGLPAKDWEMPSTVAYYSIDSRGEKTNRDTGTKDLFSSVAEQKAKSDRKKWEEEQKLKSENAKLADKQAAAASKAQAVEQAVTGLNQIIEELNHATVQREDLLETISRAEALLGTLAGTEQYESLRQQLDAAVSHVGALPASQEETTVAPQEIGPGVGPGGPTPGNGAGGSGNGSGMPPGGEIQTVPIEVPGGGPGASGGAPENGPGPGAPDSGGGPGASSLPDNDSTGPGMGPGGPG